MKKMTCIIVEDEPIAQEILIRYVRDYGSMRVLAICNDAIEAAHQLATHTPDLLFLDITMPQLSGLDFYKSLTNPPHVIFTTAYPEYAVNGFEVDAIDYLLKPFTFERFVKAMRKVEEVLVSRSTNENAYITVVADKKIYKVALDEILYLEAMGDYVKLVLAAKTLIVHQTLQRFMEQLPVQEFCRVHKSYVVSLKKFEYVEGNMVSIQGKSLPIGQTYRADFLLRLKLS